MKRLLLLLLLIPSLGHAQGSLLPFVEGSFIDSLGVPIASGFICTTISGTTTNLATYPTQADANAGTNANANPVALDSAGRANIFIGTGTYRIVLLNPVGVGSSTCNGTPTGSAVKTVDGVAGFGSLLATNNTWTGVNTFKNINGVRGCSGFAGADAGAKITACIADLPSSGGTADARGIEGTQAWGGCPFTGVTKRVDVWLGAGTITSAACTVPANITLHFATNTQFTPSGLLTINGTLDAPLTGHFATNVTFGPGVKEVSPYWFYAACDGASDDGPAFGNLGIAVSVTSTSSNTTVRLPEATCYLGNTPADGPVPNGIMNIERSNVNVKGYGKGRSVLTYTSLGANSGLPIAVNRYSIDSTIISNFTFEDFTIRDLNSMTAAAGNGAIVMYIVSGNIYVHNVEFIDIKGHFGPGSPALSIQTDNSNYNSHTEISGSDFIGTSAGGWFTSSSIQAGGPNTWVHDNKFRNTAGSIGGNGSSSGGIGNSHSWIVNNDSDNTLNPVSATYGGCVGGFTGRDVHIIGNTCVNDQTMNTSGTAGISVNDNDNGAMPPTNFTVKDVDIRDNYVRYPFAPCIQVFNNDMPENYTISNNRLYGCSLVLGGANVTKLKGSWSIDNNKFDGVAIANAFIVLGPALDAASMVSVHDNQIIDTGTPPISLLIPAGTGVNFPATLKVKNYKFWNNINAVAFADEANSRADGLTAIGTLPAAMAGMISAIQSGTIDGAITDDEVAFLNGNLTIGAGFELHGYISATDTLTWWLENKTGSDYAGGAVSTIYVVVSRQR